MHGTQVVLVDRGGDSPSQAPACHLVEAKMYSAVDARIVDIIGNLLERGVLQNDVRHGRIGQRDRMSALAVKTSQDLGTAITSARVIRGVARKTWRRDEWEESQVGIGFPVAVRVTRTNRRLGRQKL